MTEMSWPSNRRCTAPVATAPSSNHSSALAENGKNVTVIVELKARFDEARNIEWARQLEYSGVQVVYGVRGLKTHAKACIVVRREPQGFQRYCHFGTGNYNEITSRFYTDLSLLTCNRDLGNDAIAWFNAVTGARRFSSSHASNRADRTAGKTAADDSS